MKLNLVFIFICSLLSVKAQQSLTVSIVSSPANCFGTCNGSATVSASGGNTPYSYFWTPSGGTSASASSLCAGNYSCIVTDADGRSATVTAVISQPPATQLSSTTTSQACNTLGSATVLALGGVPPYTYNWPQLSVTSSVISNVAAGIYSVVVTGSTSCSRVFTLSVPSVTTANFLTVTGPSTLCGNSYNTFTASGAIAYQWSNNTTSSVSTFYIANSAPVYVASVAVTGTQAVTGCTTTVTHTMLVSKPNVAVAGPTNVCLHYATTLTASGAVSFLWNGTTAGSLLSIPSASAATYLVVGTDVSGCTDTAYHTIGVVYSPAFAVNSGTVCSGRSFVMTPTTIGAWQGGTVNMTLTSGSGTITSAFGSVTLNPPITQHYSVVAQASTGCVSTVFITTVTVVPSPTLSAATPSLCAGVQPTITVSGSPNYTVHNISPTHLFVLGINAAGCLSDTLHVYPVFYPTPTVIAVGGNICAGSSFYIQTSGAATYSITGNSFSVSPSVSTTYSVSGSSSYGCVSDTVPVTVSVTPIPQVSVNSGSICWGQFFTLVPSGAISYSVTGSSFTVSPPATTSYSVTGSTNGCPSTNTAVATVTVFPNPTVTTIPAQTVICRNEVVYVQAFGALSYSLSGVTTNSTFSISPPASTILVIVGENGNGCIDDEKIVVTVEGCAGIATLNGEEHIMVYPNPNGGSFSVRVDTDASLKIYDNTGRIFYTGAQINNSLFQINGFAPGVYLLEIEVSGKIARKKVVVE